jgi:hypothetical protein
MATKQNAAGIGSPRCSNCALMIPRCCGGGIRHASRFRSNGIIRLIDQFVHEPSGVLAMLSPYVCRYRPPSPSWMSGVGNRLRAI